VVGIANWVIGFLSFTYRLPAPQAQVYVYLAIFPVLFSVVEWSCAPVLRVTVADGQGGRRQISRANEPQRIVTWGVISGMDMATTYAGLVAPPLVAGSVHAWIAATSWASGSVTAVLTFVPEWMMRHATRTIRKELSARVA
jgi:hypothetical protein